MTDRNAGRCRPTHPEMHTRIQNTLMYDSPPTCKLVYPNVRTLLRCSTSVYVMQGGQSTGTQQALFIEWEIQLICQPPSRCSKTCLALSPFFVPLLNVEYLDKQGAFLQRFLTVACTCTPNSKHNVGNAGNCFVPPCMYHIISEHVVFSAAGLRKYTL